MNLVRLVLSIVWIQHQFLFCHSRNQLTIDILLKILSHSTCPGTVVAVPDSDWTDSRQFLDDFIQKYNKPVVYFHTNSTGNHLLYDREKICTDAIIVCDDGEETDQRIMSVYRHIQRHFFLDYILIVTETSIDHLPTIRTLKSEKILFLIRNSSDGQLDIFRWSVAFDRMLHLPNIDNRTNLELMYHRNRIHHSKWAGRPLKLATLNFPPAVLVRRDEKTNRTTFDGIEPSLLKLIADRLNFTLNFILSSDEELWGRITVEPPAGNETIQQVRYTGIRGMLAKGEVDIGFGDLNIDPPSLPYISFTKAFKTDYECFIVPVPSPLPSWMALIQPFNLPTWLATLATIFIISFVIHQTEGQHTMSVSLLSVLGQTLGVSQPQQLRSRVPTRTAHQCRRYVVLYSWLMAATILSNGYRSGLTSYLTRPFLPQPVNTIQQLADSPLNKIMFSETFKILLLNSTDAKRRQLGQQVVTTFNMSHMFSLLTAASGGRDWAVASSVDHLRYIQTGDADLRRHYHVMRQCLYPTLSSFGLQRQSPIKDEIDRLIHRLIESGLVEYHRSVDYRHHHRHVRRKVANPADGSPDAGIRNGEMVVQLSIKNLQGAFYLLAIGLALSVLTFVVEMVSFFIKPPN